MGRVPLMLSFVLCAAASGCAPDAPAPSSSDEADAPPAAVRDAGEAARDAMRKAGEALRILGGGDAEAPVETTTDAPVAVEAPEPIADGAPLPMPDTQVPPVIEPIPDETQRLESGLVVERDASVATQEAKERLIEVTRKAAERFRNAGKGVVEAFGSKDKGTPEGETPAAPEVANEGATDAQPTETTVPSEPAASAQ